MRYFYHGCAALAIVLQACGSNPPKEETTVTADTGRATRQTTDTVAQLPATYDDFAFSIQKTWWAQQNKNGSLLYSQRVDELINEAQKKFTSNDNPMGWNFEFIDEETLAELSPKDLLYYTLAYPGSYTQNCNAFAIETNPPRFYPYLPSEGYKPSPLQEKFLLLHRDSICRLLQAQLSSQDTLSIQELDLVVQLGLYEMIPVLCEKADMEANPFAFTTLMLLMEKEKYGPFYATDYYDRLYGNNSTSAYEGLPIGQKDLQTVKNIALKYYSHQTR